MKKLSVIIPVYNGKKNIERCLKSIVGQTYQNLEVILIDDASKDGSYEFIKNWIEKIKNTSIEFKIIKREKNEGVAAVRNYGILIAQGKYIAFIDQDDYILPKYCEAYINEAEEREMDIVGGGYQRVTDHGKITRRVSLKEGDWTKFMVMAPWAHIYRTDFLVKNKIQFLSTGVGEDIYFNLTAYAYTSKISIISDVSYMWVNNPDSVSNTKQRKIDKNVDPLYFMGELQKRLPRDNCLKKEYQEYFFMRYIVWYFSYVLRYNEKQEIEEMYQRMMEWLERNYPDYDANPNISILKPKGDSIVISISVWLFYSLKRIGILLSCLKILSKR